MRLTARVAVARPPLEALPPAGRDIAKAVRGTRLAHFPDAGFVKCAIYDRSAIPVGVATAGPAVIEQMDTTTIVFPGQEFERDQAGNLVLRSA